MSRSYLRDKHMDNEEWFFGNKNTAKNPHKYDERPKNNPSKYILTKVSSWKIEWLEKTPFCRGHYRPRNYHNLINGIVRAKQKEENRQIINEQLNEGN